MLLEITVYCIKYLKYIDKFSPYLYAFFKDE